MGNQNSRINNEANYTTQQFANNSLSYLNIHNNNNFQSNESNLFHSETHLQQPQITTTTQLVIEHQKIKNTKSFKNPIMLYRSSLKLERDAQDLNINYVCFKYIALKNFDIKISLNSKFKNNIVEYNDKFPTIYKSNVEKSNETMFFDKSVYLDVNKYFINDKDLLNIDKDCYDVVIELIVKKENDEIECIMASFCNLILIKKENSYLSVKIKCISQKLNIKGMWFEMHVVYGLDSSIDNSSNDCEACCTKKKNTIFLPCKHSYACNSCSVIVRLPHNQCPLCRQVVADCLIIDEM
jgi:hypothetical protein